ncbi:MAG: MetQ/NlpA family ABC transporter substrate-binding protein [Catonella sp.]|uniref:MetQ/NlpA family ABC transporter substrate-binding protein n=1 Tax=Catonella sp. TaxID=2382125 RepID=UPI003FA18D7D
MRKTSFKKIGALVLSGVLVLSLAGCGALGNSKSDDKKISIGVTPVPHQEIVEAAVVPALEKEGYKVEVVEFNDYVQPNTAVQEGELDANYYQTTRYMENENKERKLDLVAVAEIHLEPMGLYSKTLKDIKELKDGATIAIPNDGSNESRALALLSDNGLIKLKETEELYNLTSIEENPHNFNFSEIEAASLPVTLSDVDAAVINGNYALGAGFNPKNDSLILESTDSASIKQYFNDLVVKKGSENSEKIQAIKKAFTSDEVKKFIEEKYQGSVIPAF